MNTFKCALTAMLMVTVGCATSFTGSPHVEGGRAGCDAKCKGLGMSVAGFVYMGEYSSACVCEVPRATSSIESRRLLASAAGSMGAAAGVITQMRNQEQQMQQQHFQAGH
ncbi:MAG TPA: hypothetical protein VNO21_02000 [Polyangiaceae bacterium]|nr:hypothetical protein [Polyangiaceae bacterium]